LPPSKVNIPVYVPLSSQDWERIHRICAAYRLNLGGVYRRNRLGDRPGLNSGNAIEFQEHRTYQPGDDLRRLDWSAYARSGQMMIRLERQEVMPQLDVVVDMSRSMWGLRKEKARFFEETVAAVLLLSARSGLDTRCFLAGDELKPFGNTPAELILQEMAASPGEGRRTLSDHLQLIAEMRRPHASQIWISDFLFEHDPAAMVRTIAARQAPWAAIQIVDGQDRNPGVEPACLLEGCEDGSRLDITLDEGTLRGYIAAFASHVEHWRDRAISSGGLFLQLPDSPSLQRWLADEWLASGLVTT
jgi:hypothetical protein